MVEYECFPCKYREYKNDAHGMDGRKCPMCGRGLTWRAIATKPPLGIMPHKIWVQERLANINDAIIRYLEHNTPIPAEWIEEYNKLIEGITNAT